MVTQTVRKQKRAVTPTKTFEKKIHGRYVAKVPLKWCWRCFRLFHSQIVHREHVPLDLHVAIVYYLERFIVDFAMTYNNDPAFSLFSNSANTACLWTIHFIHLWSSFMSLPNYICCRYGLHPCRAKMCYLKDLDK